MQPQMPYGPPQGPYNPQPGNSPPGGPAGPYNPGSPAYPNAPGAYPPGGAQGGNPGSPYGPGGNPSGNPYGPQPGYSGAPYGNQQPPMPQYQMPANNRPQHRGPAPLPAPPPIKKTPYDFFLSQKHPTNTKGIMTKKKASLQTKLVMVGGAVLAIILIISVISALSPKDTTRQDLFGIAETQQELIRICTIGASQARYQVNRNFATNCVTGLTTDQQRLLAYLKSVGFSYKAKDLAGKTNKQTDQQLASATSSSTFDDTFKDVMEKQLSAYGSLVQAQLLTATLGDKGQALLNTDIANNKLLLQQVQAETTDLTEAAPSN